MPNTLTGLIPFFFEALNIVSREMIGFANTVQRSSTASRSAIGQQVRVPIVPMKAPSDIVPGVDYTPGEGQVIDHVFITLTKQRKVDYPWTGEEQLQAGTLTSTILGDQVLQGMRSLANEAERDLYMMAKAHVSRVLGTVGTLPINTVDDLTELSYLNKALTDNGAPQSGRSFVMGTTTRAQLEGKQPTLFKVNESGDGGALLRRRSIGQLMGLDLGVTGQQASVPAGTGAGYLVNEGTGYDIGATQITVDTGTGTILAGDVVTFNGDPYNGKYVVKTGIAGAGTLELHAPGLMGAVANNAAVTVLAAHETDIVHTPDAFVFATRPPAVPQNGDKAIDRQLLTDPVSGLTFEIALYPGYRQNQIEIGLAWGQAGLNPRHAVGLIH